MKRLAYKAKSQKINYDRWTRIEEQKRTSNEEIPMNEPLNEHSYYLLTICE